MVNRASASPAKSYATANNRSPALGRSFVGPSVIACFVIACLALACAGCSDASKSFAAASGTITAAGRPLSGAVVTFEPLAGTTGPNASVGVFDGKFDVPASSELHGGTYRVRVEMMPSELLAAIPQPQQKSLPPTGSVIAPAYDVNSQMQCDLRPGQNDALSYEVEFLR